MYIIYMYNYYVLDKLNSSIIGLLEKNEICVNHSYLFYDLKTKSGKVYSKNKYRLKPIPNNYDLIVIGAGPSGIGTVYEYMKHNFDKKVLLIEEGRPVSEYKYLNVVEWQEAYGDPNNSQYSRLD